MSSQIGKILLGQNILSPARIQSGAVSSARGITPSFKSASYASIPYERAPQVLDTVPTEDSNGQPLLAGYITPSKSWIC